MSYYQDEFYEEEYCGQCHCNFEECECFRRYEWVEHCSHCGESYEDCMCHLIDSDDGTQAQGVPFA